MATAEGPHLDGLERLLASVKGRVYRCADGSPDERRLMYFRPAHLRSALQRIADGGDYGSKMTARDMRKAAARALAETEDDESLIVALEACDVALVAMLEKMVAEAKAKEAGTP